MNKLKIILTTIIVIITISLIYTQLKQPNIPPNIKLITNNHNFTNIITPQKIASHTTKNFTLNPVSTAQSKIFNLIPLTSKLSANNSYLYLDNIIIAKISEINSSNQTPITPTLLSLTREITRTNKNLTLNIINSHKFYLQNQLKPDTKYLFQQIKNHIIALEYLKNYNNEINHIILKLK